MPEPTTLCPRTVKRKALVRFSRQLAAMLKAGVPLPTALEILEDLTEDALLSECLGNVRVNVAKSASLSMALRRQPIAFSPAYVEVVARGEAAEELPDALSRLADAIGGASARTKASEAIRIPAEAVGLGVGALVAAATVATFLNLPTSSIVRSILLVLAGFELGLVLSYWAFGAVLKRRRASVPSPSAQVKGAPRHRRLKELQGAGTNPSENGRVRKGGVSAPTTSTRQASTAHERTPAASRSVSPGVSPPPEPMRRRSSENPSRRAEPPASPEPRQDRSGDQVEHGERVHEVDPDVDRVALAREISQLVEDGSPDDDGG